MSRIEPFWQWLVLTAAVVSHAIAGGITFSVGVLYTDIRDRLRSEPPEIAVIGAITFACYCFVAPFTRALTGKLGSRIVAVLGSMIAALGLILCAVAPSIYFYYVFFGMFVGGGYGMIAVASSIIVRAYFTTNTGMPFTLLYCGFPAGVFVFSLITRVLIDNYSYFGMFLISAAIMMNCIVCALLYKPVPKSEIKTTETNGDYERMERPVENRAVFSARNTPHSDGPNASNQSREISDVDKSNETPTEKLKTNNPKTYKAVEGPSEEIVVSTLEKSWKFTDTVLYESDDDDEHGATAAEKVKKKTTADENIVRATPEDDVDGADSVGDALREPKNGEKDQRPAVQTLLGVVTGISEAKQLCQWRMLVYTLACVAYSLGYGIPFFFLPDIGRFYGHDDSKAIWALSLLGLGSLVSVVVIAAVNRATRSRLTCASTLIAALSTLAFGLVIGFGRYYRNSDLSILLFASFVIGLFSIPFNFLKYFILHEIVPDKNISPYMVLTSWCSGAAFLLGIPIAGWLRATDDNYDNCFVLVACSCGVTSLFLIPLLIWRRLASSNYDL